jgi:hypothetical protein
MASEGREKPEHPGPCRDILAMSRHPSSLVAASLLVFLLTGVLRGEAYPGKDKQPATYTISLPPKPDFSPLAWLVGDWAGQTTGKDSQGDVHLTVSYSLDQRFVLIKEEVSLPAGKTAPAVHEAWMGFLAPEPSRAGYQLQIYSSTGFITLYRVTVTPDEVRFDPEGGANPPPGWLFRRRITRLGLDFFNDKVEVAPPSGAFFEYYSAKLTRVIQSKPAATQPAATPPPAAP